MRQQAKYALKWIVAQTLYRTGVLHACLHLRHRRRAIVLTYHRVLPEPLLDETWSHPAIIVTRPTFARQLTWLRRVFHVLSAADFISHMELGKPFRGPACLITFDDGWQDTFSEAGPLLKQYALPSIVFLPIDFIGSTIMFWQEHLGRLLYRVWDRGRREPDLRARAEALLPAELREALGVEESRVRVVIREAVNRLKAHHSADPRELVENLRALLGIEHDASVDRFMDWDQVRSMAADGATFGGHSASHRIMTTLSADEIASEVRTCREALQRELGKPPLTFSYPNGDWNEAASRSVREAGFRVSFATGRGSVSVGDDRFSIRRINVHEDTTSSLPMFMAKIVGVF